MKGKWSLQCLALLFLLSACGNDGGSSRGAAVSAETLAGPGPFAVGVTTLTLVDAHRPTPPSGPFAGSPVRTLMTDVYYPAEAGGMPGETVRDAPVNMSDGPFPLLLFAHGLFGQRTNWSGTLAHLTSHGYVVAAPDFPLTNFATFGAGTVNLVDLLNQPGDLSFVLDTLSGLGDAAGAPIAAAVDAEAVGLFGHSFGGATTFLAAYGGPLVEPRLDAAAAVAPATCFFGPDMFAGRSLPFLLLHGTSDAIVDPAWSVESFVLIPPPKLLAEIVGGDHLGFLSDPTLPPGLRDTDVLGVFTAEADTVSEQGVPLGLALIEQVPGADPARCLERPPFPDPSAERDPVLAVERQRRITDVALTAFFAAFVRGDAAAEGFLLQEFPDFAPEVRFSEEW